MNGLTDKSHMIISINAEKVFDKIQYDFMVKVQENKEPEGT